MTDAGGGGGGESGGGGGDGGGGGGGGGPIYGAEVSARPTVKSLVCTSN